MAIVFIKQKKRQNVLIIVFALVIIISVIILWQGFFKEETPLFPGEVFLPPAKEIKIDFGVLEKIKEFQPFPEIKPFEKIPATEDEPGGIEIGRENPFFPY